MKKIFYAVFITFFVFTQTIWASSDVRPILPQEQKQLLVYTDKDLYLSGEILWFSVFVQSMVENQSPEGTSNSPGNDPVHVHLISLQGDVAMEAQLLLTEGAKSGSFYIPAGLGSGEYLLTAFLGRDGSKGISTVAQKLVRILDPLQENFRSSMLPEIEALSDTQLISSAVEDSFAITFPEGSRFGTRENGVFRIETSRMGKPARFSISVYLAPPAELLPTRTGSKAYSASIDIPSEGESISIENPHRRIRVEIRDKISKRPRAEEYFFLAFPGKKERFYLSKSDPAGIASFSIDPVWGNQGAVLVAVSGIPIEMEVLRSSSPDPQHLLTHSLEVESPSPMEQASETDQLFKLSESVEDWLENQFIYVQSENAYFRKERAVWDYSPTHYRAPIYGDADRVYRLDDYTRFVLMEEVIREYIPEVSLVRRSGRYEFRVHDQRRNLFFNDNPLVLFDGVPTRDIDKIIAYDPRKIEEIAIITSKFYYGPLEFPGVVSFKTYDGDLKDFEMDPESHYFEYDGLQLVRQFFAPSYAADAPTYPASIPDFRNVLFWSGMVETDGQEDLLVPFSTSDISGEFRIVIQGVDENGQPLRASSSFTVQN